MSHDKALVMKRIQQIGVRERIKQIDGVRRTWFEWEFEAEKRTRVLVVEVGFDLDPDGSHFPESRIDDIEETATTLLRDETTLVVGKMRIVPAA